MIKEFIELWHQHKKALKQDLSNMTGDNLSYKELVKLVVVHILNKGEDQFDIEDLVEIDHGSYSGTQIYIIPKENYSPNIEDYYWTNNYYGSCSGCDTLQGILAYSDEKLDEEQLADLMLLCLNLVESFKRLVFNE